MQAWCSTHQSLPAEGQENAQCLFGFIGQMALRHLFLSAIMEVFGEGGNASLAFVRDVVVSKDGAVYMLALPVVSV